MAKVQSESNPQVNQIFEDLEKYLDFCVTYGYKYDEKSLYDMKNYSFQQFSKFMSHKNFKDQWQEDSKRFENQVVF
jgi:hypothetical protein